MSLKDSITIESELFSEIKANLDELDSFGITLQAIGSAREDIFIDTLGFAISDRVGKIMRGFGLEKSLTPLKTTERMPQGGAA